MYNSKKKTPPTWLKVNYKMDDLKKKTKCFANIKTTMTNADYLNQSLSFYASSS